MQKRTFKRPVALAEVFQQAKKALESPQEEYVLYPLQLLAEHFRSRAKSEDPNLALEELNDYLKNNPYCLKVFCSYLGEVLEGRSFKSTLIDLGILVNSDFLFELKKRLAFKLLPYQPNVHTLEFVLSNVFYVETDANWINQLDLDKLEELFKLLDFQPLQHKEEKSKAFSEFLFALNVLSMRICGRAMESEVMKMAPEYERFDSPFIALQTELASFISKVDNQELRPKEDNLQYKQILVLIEQCRHFIEEAYKNTEAYGITIRVNQNLLRISQQLNRLEMLLNLVIEKEDQSKHKDTIELILKLISLNCQKNNVRNLISESTRSLAYEITQHTGKTGEKYITTTASGYWKMFLTAMGGGIVVGFLCMIKLLLSLIDTSPFGYAVLYSLNYSAGFIAIYLLHFTLATKQPAMTASTLAQALSKDLKEKEKYKHFSNLFARLFRSQFIAFIGNVILSFPVAFLLAYALESALGHNPAALKSEEILNSHHPFKSFSLFFAALTGFYLFLSGIIAGSVDNRLKHYKIPSRIKHHPFLLSLIGKNRARKLAAFYEANSAGVMSNLWFGVFLGCTASVGYFLGIPLDIRHISFAAGNVALGLYGADWEVARYTLYLLFTSVALIGLLNFWISFGFTLILALRSRGVPLKDLTKISKSILAKFFANPFVFFFPPFPSKKSREPDEKSGQEEGSQAPSS